MSQSAPDDTAGDTLAEPGTASEDRASEGRVRSRVGV